MWRFINATRRLCALVSVLRLFTDDNVVESERYLLDHFAWNKNAARIIVYACSLMIMIVELRGCL